MARGGDRTPEERERARLERAAKRAAREGRPPPTELPSMEVRPPLPEAEPRLPEPVEEPRPLAPEPVESVSEPPVGSPIAEEPPVAAEPPAAPEPPAAAEPPPAEEPPAAFEQDDFLAEPSPTPAAGPLPETADLPAVEPEPELFYDPLDEPEAAPAEPVAAEEPFETGEHPVEEEPFETGEHPVEEEPLEEDPLETGEHAFEGEPFETGEHLVEDEPFETGEHAVADDPSPEADHPEPRPLAALPVYPPPASGAAAATAAAPAIEQRRRRAKEVLDRHGADAAVQAPRKRRSKARYLVLGILAVIVVGVAWVANSLFQPFKGDGSGRAAVQIPTGASVGQIGDLLEERGVISSAFFFEARATLAGRRDDFKAGRFTLANGMSNTAAMDAISQGPPADVTQVVIPEGRARTQVRDLIGKRLRGNYLTLTRSSPALDPRRYGAPRSVSNLEGFLFPDTYELKKGATTRTLVRTQLAQFKREFAKVDLGAAKRRKLNAYDVLTIASMIDQEAQVPRERRLVASVIYNRLREGIPLGIDATTRYATNNRTRPLTRSELETNSPYNTRNRRGLPPGPIGSPGLAAIRAAANPARTGFLFYVVKPCGNGSHAFSRTNAEFERDVARYNTERTRRGGKSPSRC